MDFLHPFHEGEGRGEGEKNPQAGFIHKPDEELQEI